MNQDLKQKKLDQLDNKNNNNIRSSISINTTTGTCTNNDPITPTAENHCVQRTNTNLDRFSRRNPTTQSPATKQHYNSQLV